MATTTKDVRDALEAELSNVETENSDLAGGLRATLSEAEAGLFFKVVRQNGFEAQTKRIGDTLVAHIEAEEEEGLGALFG